MKILLDIAGPKDIAYSGPGLVILSALVVGGIVIVAGLVIGIVLAVRASKKRKQEYENK